MKRTIVHQCRVFLFIFAALALAVPTAGLAHASPAQTSNPPTDEVVVKPKSGVTIGTILARYNASLLSQITESDLYTLQLPSGETADQMLPILNTDTDLYYAEPNYYVDGGPLAAFIEFGGNGGLQTVTPTPSASDQWAWTEVGMSDAQKESTGQGVIVAVLDTGLATDHPMLDSSIDDGYDFVGMDSNFYDSGSGSYMGHGTHVSGIIITEAPRAQVMPVRVLNSDGFGTYEDVAAGIHYAVDHGAKIINMSMSAPLLTPSLSEALNYASSHGVIIVAASGTGAGPNYPSADTSDSLLLGVGSTDQNNNITSFSGQPGDTKVFAPGVDIYSAYPYNGYALGTGTSMSTAMVSGEAALLMSRYPDWTPAQIVQRIMAETVPVAGASAGRISLSEALNTGLEVNYAVGDINSPNDNGIKPDIELVNNTPQDIPLSQLTVRYWYTVDSNQAQTFNCDYASIGCSGIVGTFTSIPNGSPNKTATSDTYLQIGFNGSAGNLVAGGRADMNLRINKNDWSNYNELNDYSYDPTKTALAHWNHITIYQNGTLVWGVEPSGTQTGPTATSAPPTSTAAAQPSPTSPPPATATPLPATKTPAPTATAYPSATPTRASTATTIPATKTPTPAPANTNTPVSPTSTPSGPTATPANGAIDVQIVSAGTDNNQVSAFHIRVQNTGTSAQSNFSVRIYFTPDGSNPASSYVLEKYWDQSGTATISGPTQGSGNNYYFTINYGNASLAAGNSWEFDTALHLSSWASTIDSSNDFWHTSGTLPSSFTNWTNLPLYVNNTLDWGSNP